MSHASRSLPGGVVPGWTHARTGPPAPCVFGDGLTVCRSPVKDVPCHKACAETWITTRACGAAERAALVRAHTPRPRTGGAR